MLTLGHVLEALTGYHMAGGAQVITDVVIDSRLVIPGAMFVALVGAQTDGHDYVASAFEQGAIAALVTREMDELPTLDLRQPVSYAQASQLSIPVCLRVNDTVEALQVIARHWRARLSNAQVVGITGSVGKTTTKELIYAVLKQRYRTIKSHGNFNNEIGLPLSILRMTEATEYAVLEMGFYVPGEIALLCEIARPQIGVITNVYPVHLERAGSLENIIRGKGELVEALPSEGGVAVLNRDEPAVMGMTRRNPQVKIITYGLDPQATIWADNVVGLGLNGIRFQLHYRRETLHLNVPMLGRHAVHTVLRAVAVGLATGLTWQEIINGLQSSQARSQLRLVAVQGPNGSLLLDDTYNASPESTIAALNLLADMQANRRVAVLGDMLELGHYEVAGHRRVGSRAREVADVLLTVGERARLIADQAHKAGMPAEVIHQFDNSEAALNFLREYIEEGDVVLVKGSRATHLDTLVTSLEVIS